MKNSTKKTVLFAVAAITLALTGCSQPNSGIPGQELGSISGTARFSSGANHAGIVVTLEKTDGLRSLAAVSASRSIVTGADPARSLDAARSVQAQTSTNSDGSYIFSHVAPGFYTVYASSQNSSERAVAVNVQVSATMLNSTAPALQLTPIGFITGRISLDNSTTGNFGFLISIAGTSYMAITDDTGNFTINGIPAAENAYYILIMRGNYAAFWNDTPLTVRGGEGTSLGTKNLTGAELIDSFITIGTNGNWFINGIDTGVPAQGPKGDPGTPGSIVTICDVTGNWLIDGINTGIKAQGDPGKDGSVVTIVGGYWHIDGVNTGVSAIGQKGADGTDGSVVTIVGGYWYIDGVNTGVSAIGQTGADGHTPVITIVGGFWHVDDVSTGVSAIGQTGADGHTPVITIVGGFWHVDGVSTGVLAQGQNGETPHIGTNGNWWVGSTDTGVKAEGGTGQPGLNSYLVIFDGNGGTPHINAVSVLHGNPVQKPTDPVRKGYPFIDWYTEAQDGTLWNFVNPITSNLTLYAQWEEYNGQVDLIYSTAEVTAFLNSLPFNNPGNPYSLPLALALGNMTAADSGWRNLLTAIEASGRFVNLDLTACTMTGTAFNADTSVAAGKYYIVSLTLPEVARSVSGIGSTTPATRHFTNLTAASSTGVTSIDSNAFYGCTSLASISFSAAATINTGAFRDCTNLTIFNLTGTGDLSVIEEGRAIVRNGTELVVYPSASGAIIMDTITAISDRVFQGNTSLTSVSFPAVTSIGSEVFNDCTSLAWVDFPVATSIGNQAFIRNTSLTSVTFPAATEIGGIAFSGCTSLISADFPAATSIGSSAFSGCTSLINADFPLVISIEGVSWLTGAFEGCTSLNNVSFPMATSIGNRAFFGCTSLASVSFPASTSIGSQAFSGCTSLTSVSFPAATEIGGNAFRGCTSLTNVSFPLVTSIGEQTFHSCTSLANVSFPAATFISHGAFDGCSSLVWADFSLVTIIGQEVFSNTGTIALTVTLGLTTPSVGTAIFSGISAAKDVTVWVPAEATGYTGFPPENTTSNTWANAFRGRGWNGTSYQNGSVNANINLMLKSYYYIITFNANGGTVTPANAETDTNGRLASLPTPARDGWIFTGWWTAVTDGAQIFTNTVFTENTIVYAHWEPASIPSPPANLTASNVTVNGMITNVARLRWDAVNNATSYRIYRRLLVTGSNFELIYTVAGDRTENTVQSASYSYNYIYGVTAVNSLGESAMSTAQTPLQ